MAYNTDVEAAKALATRAHSGQTDKAGLPLHLSSWEGSRTPGHAGEAGGRLAARYCGGYRLEALEHIVNAQWWPYHLHQLQG